MLSCRCRQQGFTLVEVLVALTIFLIASMGLVPLLLTGMRIGQHNAVHGQARRLAGEAMAVLQSTDYWALPVFDGLSTGDGTLRLSRSVESNVPEPGQTRLTVTVTWQLAGHVHRYQLQSLRAEP
jgi:prepilin-type N-terminal cleavage/methylation domain-containing protein